MLLDAGHTTIARLTDMGINLHDIDLIFISHFHTDHFADALPLVHSRWVDDIYSGNKVGKEITIIGPKTLKERWQKLQEIFWTEKIEKYPVTFKEEPGSASLGDIKMKFFPVHHIDAFHSLGIKLSIGKKVLAYTGDIGMLHPISDLKKRFKNIDYLIIEAATLHPSPNHLTLDQVIDLSQSCNIGKTIITHLRDDFTIAYQKKLKAHPNIILAKDLMEVLI